MPKRQVEKIAHAALTNHRMVARPGEPLPEAAFRQTTADLPDLVYVNRPPASNRASLPPVMLLEAYGELMEKEPAYQARYLDVLEELGKSASDLPLVEAALGRKMLRSAAELNPDAIRHLTKAIEMGFSVPTVYEDLADSLSRAVRVEEAINALQRGIEANSYSPVLFKSLALRYINTKRYPEARKTLERYFELFPEDDFVRGLLAK